MILREVLMLLLFESCLGSFSLDELNSIFYDVKLDVNNPLSFSKLAEQEKESEKNYSHLRLSSQFGQEFVCKVPTLEAVLPNLSQNEQTFPEDFTSVKVIDTIRSGGFITRPCLKKTVGWWTYEICLGVEVKQYHLEGADIVGGAISLGYFENDFDWDEFVNERNANSATGKPTDMYHSQYFVNGTLCGIKHSLRKTEVKFYCDEELHYNEAYVHRVDEPSTCEYIIIIHIGSLCKLAQFTPVDRPKVPHAIICHPLLQDDKHEQYLKAKAEEDEIRMKREQEMKASKKSETELTKLLKKSEETLSPLQMFRKSAMISEAMKEATAAFEKILRQQAQRLGMDADNVRLLNFDLNLFGSRDVNVELADIYNSCPKLTWRDVLLDGRDPSVDYMAIYREPEMEIMHIDDYVDDLDEVEPTEYTESARPYLAPTEPAEAEERLPEDIIWDRLMEEPEEGNMFRYMFFYYIKDVTMLTEEQVVKAASPKFQAKSIRDEIYTHNAKYDVMEDILLYDARQLLLVSKRLKTLRKEAESKGEKFVEMKSVDDIFDYFVDSEEEDADEIMLSFEKIGSANLARQEMLAEEQKTIEKQINPNVIEPQRFTDREKNVWQIKLDRGEETTLLDYVVDFRVKFRVVHGQDWRTKYFQGAENPQRHRFKKLTPSGQEYYTAVPDNSKINADKREIEVEGEDAYSTPNVISQIQRLIVEKKPASTKLIDKIWDTFQIQETFAEQGETYNGGEIEEKFWEAFMTDDDEYGNSAFRRSFLENLRTLEELQVEPVDDELKPVRLDFALPWSDDEYESMEDLLIHWVRTRVLSTRRQKYLDRERASKGIDVHAMKVAEIVTQKYNNEFQDHVEEMRKYVVPLQQMFESRDVDNFKENMNEYTKQPYFNYDKFYQLPREKLADFERDAIHEAGGDAAANEPLDFTEAEMDLYDKYIKFYNKYYEAEQRATLQTELAFNERLKAVKYYGRGVWKEEYFERDESPQSFRHLKKPIVLKESPKSDTVLEDKFSMLDKLEHRNSRQSLEDFKYRGPMKETQEENKFDVGTSKDVKVQVQQVDRSDDVAFNKLHRKISPHTQRLEDTIKQKLKASGFDSQASNVQIKIITGGIVDENSDANFKMLTDEEMKQFSDMLMNVLGADSESSKEEKKYKSLESAYNFKFDKYADHTEEAQTDD